MTVQHNNNKPVSGPPSSVSAAPVFRRLGGLAAAAIVLGGTLPSPSRGAAPTDATAADTASDAGLSEITVTAERQKSTIQDTPISISAMSGEQLNAAGLTRVEDIAHEVPGLSMRTAGPGLTEYEARARCGRV